MNKTNAFMDIFLQHLAASHHECLMVIPSFEQNLVKIVDSAQQTYPTIHLPVEKYLAFIAERLNTSTDCRESFQCWRMDDLYLICGCLAGIPEAFIAFEKQIYSFFEGQLLSILKSQSMVCDLKQSLLKDLFVAEDGSEPKINHYVPQKDLRNWVCIVAIRKAINLSQKTKRELQPLEKDFAHIALLKDDPELEYFKSLYYQEFTTAFQQALGLLSPQERNLLRYHVLDALNIEQIGIITKMHRATVARWLAKIRRKLLSKTRRIIMQKLKASPTEYESIMRLIKSQLYVSIKEHLNIVQEDT